ncbi:MAG TPA: hypothetical protein VES88_12045 [Gemmatimonadaceae bacterium]|nr:hypothetical protein [Gemmatimonadaceae bacterium]
MGMTRTAHSQTDAGVASATPPIVFLEKAYFSLGTPTGKKLLFEGQPSAHFFFRNGLSNPVWQKRGGWQYAVPLSALFLVRMKDTVSAPVLTPSYRIRPLYLQLFHLSRSRNKPADFRLFGIGLGATHYSNGQRGCTYLGFFRTAGKEECEVSDPVLAGQSKANLEDGDFSTTYFSLAVNVRWGRLQAPHSPLARQLTIGGEFQAHPFNVRPGGINAAQAREWGQHQWSLSAEWEYRIQARRWPGVTRLAGDFTQRFGGQVDSPLNATTLEASYVLDRVEHLGIFVRQHFGFDYYNIHFQERKPFFAIGVLWDPGRLDVLESDYDGQ